MRALLFSLTVLAFGFSFCANTAQAVTKIPGFEEIKIDFEPRFDVESEKYPYVSPVYWSPSDKSNIYRFKNNSYLGFTFSKFGILDSTNEATNRGYNRGNSKVDGGKYVAYNDNGRPATISSATNFQFESGYFTPANYEFGILTITGAVSTMPGFSEFVYTCIISLSEKTSVGFNDRLENAWDDSYGILTDYVVYGLGDLVTLPEELGFMGTGMVDSITFEMAGFGNRPNSGKKGNQVVFDDLSFYVNPNQTNRYLKSNFIKATPTPEPATLFAVGAGFLGLMAVRRKRKS